LLPGSAYEFSVTAKAGDRLSFATMFVQSNDLFYAPHQAGANSGADEGGNVRLVDDGFSYPSVGSIIKVTVSVQ